MKPHKHAELIKAWADGAEIQVNTIDNQWVDTCTPSWFLDFEYRIKPEPKPDVPDGLIDPKSYYEGYEDGVNAIDLRPISWMKDCGGFTDDPVLAVEDGFNIPVYISKENYKKIKQRKPEPKPDVVLYANCSKCLPHIKNQFYADLTFAYSSLPTNDNPANLKLTFDGETGELKSAEVLK